MNIRERWQRDQEKLSVGQRNRQHAFRLTGPKAYVSDGGGAADCGLSREASASRCQSLNNNGCWLHDIEDASRGPLICLWNIHGLLLWVML